MRIQRLVLSGLVMTSFLIAQQVSEPAPLNLFILSFDNYLADPEIDWLREGFVDFIADYCHQNYPINVQRTVNLDRTIEQVKKEAQQQTRKNFILTGSFKRVSEKFEIELQLTDMSTWKPSGNKKVTETTTDLAKVIESVNKSVIDLLKIALPPAEQKQIVSPPKRTGSDTLSLELSRQLAKYGETAAATRKITFELEKLSDGYRSGKTSEEPPSRLRTDYTDQEQVNILKKFDTPVSLAANFINVLDRIIVNPYQVEISDPVFRRDALDEERLKINLKVKYTLRRELIQEMLQTLPYELKNIQSGYVEYVYNADKYVFGREVLDLISTGKLRVFPLLKFLDKQDNLIFMVVDVPQGFGKSLPVDSRFLYVSQFKPLFNIHVAAREVRIQLNNSDLEFEYKLELPYCEALKVDHINVHYFNEDRILQSFGTRPK